MLQRY